MKTMQLNAVLERPDISSIASTYDTRLAKPGAFKEAVIRHGSYRWDQGVDLTPDQAALEVIKIYGLDAVQPGQNGAQPGANGQGAGPNSGKKVVQRNTNTIPNITGRSGASPLKSKPRSIEDLKTIYNNMTSQQ